MKAEATEETRQESYTVQEAALRLGKTVRTVQRMLAAGQLGKSADGRISAEQVEDLLEVSTDEVTQAQVLRELRLSVANSNQHALACGKQMLETVQGSLDALRAENARLAAQNQEFQEIHLQTIGIVGDVLMRQEERKAIAAEAEQSAALRARGFDMLVQWAPKLAEQLSTQGKVRKAVQSLTDEEAAMIELGLEQLGERGDALKDLLRMRKDGAQ